MSKQKGRHTVKICLDAMRWDPWHEWYSVPACFLPFLRRSRDGSTLPNGNGCTPSHQYKQEQDQQKSLHHNHCTLHRSFVVVLLLICTCTSRTPTTSASTLPSPIHTTTVILWETSVSTDPTRTSPIQTQTTKRGTCTNTTSNNYPTAFRSPSNPTTTQAQ